MPDRMKCCAWWRESWQLPQSPAVEMWSRSGIRCSISSWHWSHSILCFVMWFSWMNSTSVNRSMCATSAWQALQRFFLARPEPRVTSRWHSAHSAPFEIQSVWRNGFPATVRASSGGPWHVPQSECAALSEDCLRWHRKQVEVVTLMWLPWTICEWQLVQRS